MPIYEYECENCGRIEAVQKVTDKPLTQCPVCKERGKKSKVQKLVSASAFHLKGGGWYKTDYSSGNNGGKKPAAEKSETPAADNKPDAPKKKASGGCGGSCSCH